MGNSLLVVGADFVGAQPAQLYGTPAHKRNTLDLTFFCCHLEMQITFEQGVLHFYFVLDPANDKTSLSFSVILYDAECNMSFPTLGLIRNEIFIHC